MGCSLFCAVIPATLQVLPCNIESMTGKAAAKKCAQTWMGGRDVPSEVITDSDQEYTSEWWKE